MKTEISLCMGEPPIALPIYSDSTAVLCDTCISIYIHVHAYVHIDGTLVSSGVMLNVYPPSYFPCNTDSRGVLVVQVLILPSDFSEGDAVFVGVYIHVLICMYTCD